MDAQHKHDCDDCKFLGTNDRFDLYFCPSSHSVIARYGVDGDYYSSLNFVNSMPILALAFVRAMKAGYLKIEDLP